MNNFRAWDENGRRYEGSEVCLIGELVIKSSYSATRWVEEAQLFNLCQYTGLKDKNGVEIYEGDIVKITNTERFCGENYTCYSEVKKIDGHIYVWPHPVADGEIKRFGAKLLFSGMAKYIKDKGVATEDVEVIGTLYENPELLEVAE